VSRDAYANANVSFSGTFNEMVEENKGSNIIFDDEESKPEN
jgi:hypothetical protein